MPDSARAGEGGVQREAANLPVQSDAPIHLAARSGLAIGAKRHEHADVRVQAELSCEREAVVELAVQGPSSGFEIMRGQVDARGQRFERQPGIGFRVGAAVDGSRIARLFGLDDPEIEGQSCPHFLGVAGVQLERERLHSFRIGDECSRCGRIRP